MHRIFLGLAITCGSLLVASFAFGFWVACLPQGHQHDFFYGIHFLLGLLTVLTALLVHSIVFTYFLGTGRWVKEVVQVYKLPAWVYAQSVTNKRKAFPFVIWSMTLVGVTTWFGAGTATRGWPSLWHLVMAALGLAFNLGSFVFEYAVIVAQARLLLEVKAEADRIRDAQMQAAATASGAAPSGPASESQVPGNEAY